MKSLTEIANKWFAAFSASGSQDEMTFAEYLLDAAYSDAVAYSEIINDNSSLMHGAQVEAIAVLVTL